MFAKKSHAAPTDINKSHRTHSKTRFFHSKCDASQPPDASPVTSLEQHDRVWETWYTVVQPGVVSTPNLLAQTMPPAPLEQFNEKYSPGTSPKTPSSPSGKRWRIFGTKKTADSPKHHPDAQGRKSAPKLLKKPKKFKSTPDLNVHTHGQHMHHRHHHHPSTLIMSQDVPPVPDLCEQLSPPAPETPTPETPTPTPTPEKTYDEDSPLYFVIDPCWDSSSDVDGLFIPCPPLGFIDSEASRREKRFRREVFIRGPPSSERLHSSFLGRRPSWASLDGRAM